MDKDKSILEKFTDTMKGLADSASEALKSEEPANAPMPVTAYMPLGAEGLVSDPLLVPPVAAQPVRKKRRAAKRSTKTAKTSASKTSARTVAKKSAAARSKKSAKKTTKKSAKKATAKKPARVSAKKRSTKAAKRRR